MKGSGKKLLKSCACGIVLSQATLTTGVNASDNWQELPQPIGQIVNLWSASSTPWLQFIPIGPVPMHSIPFPTTGVQEVNYICAQWDSSVTSSTLPFETTVSVTEITPTQTSHFVRFYTIGSSGPGGPWMAASSEVRGLTPAQIRDRLALPLFPDTIISVDIPTSPDPVTSAQYGIWTGVAGPIPTFGNSQGGAVQNRVMATSNHAAYFPYIYDGIRYNSQPLGLYALAYSPLAGGGNVGSIANYLDQFIPIPDSDLDTVYTSLDFLNWTGFDPSLLQQALNQISPECYGSLPYVGMRNSLLFANAILERYFPLRECQEACQPTSCNNHLWVQGVIESGNQKSGGGHPGFDYDTYGTVVSVDFQPLRNIEVGAAASWLFSDVHFGNGVGGADINTVKGGLYASYTHSCFFVDALLGGGYHWTSARRSIDFPIATTSAAVTALGTTIPLSNTLVDRKAYSDQTGYDLEGHLQAGFNFQRNCWWAAPLARISYFYERNNAFKEQSADSLNLKVHALEVQDLRTYLGGAAARTFCFNCVTLIPQIQMMWIHDFIFNDRLIDACIEELEGSFSTEFFRRDNDSFFGGVGLKMLLPNNMSFFLLYEIEAGERFISNSGILNFGLVF